MTPAEPRLKNGGDLRTSISTNDIPLPKQLHCHSGADCLRKKCSQLPWNAQEQCKIISYRTATGFRRISGDCIGELKAGFSR